MVTDERVRTILSDLTVQERQLLTAVLKAEREKLYMKLPRGINEDIWKAVTEVIK